MRKPTDWHNVATVDNASKHNLRIRHRTGFNDIVVYCGCGEALAQLQFPNYRITETYRKHLRETRRG